MGWPDTRLTDRLKIEHPIFCAPMAGSMNHALAAEVAEAGGLGSLPCAMLEVRNDQIADAEGQARWAARLAADFRQALVGLHSERRWGSTEH